MQKRFQIVVSVSVLTILIFGIFAYSLWTERILYSNLKQQALKDNMTIGESVIRILDKSGVAASNQKDFVKVMQQTCDVLRLPNQGYLCMIDSLGNLLAAPGLKPQQKQNVRSASYLSLNRLKKYSFKEFYHENPFQGYYEYETHNYSDIVTALTHRFPNYKILVHQNAHLIQEQASQKSRPLFYVGILMTFVLSVLTYFIVNRQVKSYQFRIDFQKKKLEIINREIKNNNLVLEHSNQKLRDLAEEKDALLGIMAHDLKNPLSGMQTVVTLVNRAGDLNTEQQEYFGLLGDQVIAARNLIEDVLEMNRIENTEADLELYDLDVIFLLTNKMEQFKTLADRKELNLQFVSDEKHLKIKSAESELGRIVDNLLSNAIKFSPHGKTVTIQVKQENAKVQILFKDEGEGIPEEEKEQLFRKFSKLSTRPTNNESSTGLGLYIVKLLASKINGNIKVDSTVGKGTIFTIELDLT